MGASDPCLHSTPWRPKGELRKTFKMGHPCVGARLVGKGPRALEGPFCSDGAPRSGGKKAEVEKLWLELFSEPTEWTDHRLGKPNPRFPDFKHKKHKEKALWLNSIWIPPRVEEALAALPPGSIQLSTFSRTQQLSRYAQAGQYEKTMELFEQMQRDGETTDIFTFFPVLKACGRLGLLDDGRRIHKMMQPGLEADLFIGSCLVDMYAKCGSIEEAEIVFNQMPTRDVVAWNAMIGGYVRCGDGQKALERFEEMQGQRVATNSVTFLGVLNACASISALKVGRRAHEEIKQRGYDSEVVVENSLVDMYAKCGSIEEAEKVFDQMPTKGVVAWTAMFVGYVKCGEGRKALELFEQMQEHRVVLDPVTFVGFLNACASVTALEVGRRIHEETIHKGYESEVALGNSLVDMYAKCGSIEEAERVFNQMPMKNVVSWSAMISGYVKCREGQKALELFGQMQGQGVDPNCVTFVGVLNACASIAALEAGRRAHEEIVSRGYESDVVVGTCLVDMYAKCGSIEEAEGFFNQMPTRNVVTWNAMISGYVKCGEGQKALELYGQMEERGLGPNCLTFVGVLNACASVAALEVGRYAHEEIIHRGYESEVVVGNSLIDMYAKCGSIEEAERVFIQMPIKNEVSWNAMLAGYGTHGYARKALETFRQMCKTVEPNHVTFISLLSACSHGGLVDEGLECFKSMNTVHNITPTVEHFTCVIDLLGRAGRLSDAEDLIMSMPMDPSLCPWMVLLGACRTYVNVEIGERCSKRVLESDPDNAAAYVLLSNIYAAAGKLESSARLNAENSMQV